MVGVWNFISMSTTPVKDPGSFFTSWEHTYAEWKTREAGGDDSCWTICVQYASFYSWLVFTGRKPKGYEECVDLLCIVVSLLAAGEMGP